MEDRYSLPPDVTAALERARLQVEALAQTADKLQVVLPDAVGSALRDGLREEAAPISRRLAEVKGLSNQLIRRLERIETDLLAERHARIDDLALLVELITSQWRAMNERLDQSNARSSREPTWLALPSPADVRGQPLSGWEHQLEPRAPCRPETQGGSGRQEADEALAMVQPSSPPSETNARNRCSR